MKLAQEVGTVSIAGAVSAPSRFNITASKEAFKILSSGLYNNKILAIIRELSCNAYDAHVAAGIADQPFELHLPTTFEPTFLVKDHGTGLEYRVGGCDTCMGSGKVYVDEYATSADRATNRVEVMCPSCDGTGDYDAVKELYCNYFSSNKSNSNLFIGALGLGSKSPFCYTEGFSVKNTYDGVTRVYSCFLNEEGMPAVLLQSIEQTPDAHAGVEVSFPVKQRDVWEFENQAARALEFFQPRPILNVEVNIREAEYVMRSERWGLRKNDKLGKQVRAIQGFVAYAVGDIDTSKLTDDQRDLLSLPLDLFFPIGELSVAASRESLSNDTHTVANILNALVKVKEHLLDDVKQQLAKVHSRWEARVLLYSLSNAQGIGKFISRAYSAGEFNGIYQGWTLTNQDPSINQIDFPHVKIFEYSKTWRGRGHRKAAKVELTEEIPTTTAQQLPGFSKKRYDIYFSIQHEATSFVINDLGFGGDKYLTQLVQRDEEYKAGTAYLINRPGKDVTQEQVMADAYKIIEQLGNPPFLLMSELKERYKEVMRRDPSKVRDLLWWDTTNHIEKERNSSRHNTVPIAGWKAGWENAAGSKPPDPEELKFYVPIKKLVPMVGNFDCGYDFKQFVVAVRALQEEFGLRDAVLYGVPERHLDDLDDTWVNFVGHVMAHIEAIMTPEREEQLSLHLNPFSSTQKWMLRKIGEDGLLPTTSPLHQFCNDYLAAEQNNKKNIADLAIIIAKAEALGVYKLQHTVDFNARWAVLKRIYPLLDEISEYHFRTEDRIKNATLDYINMIDARNAELILGVADNQLAFTFQEETEHANAHAA